MDPREAKRLKKGRVMDDEGTVVGGVGRSLLEKMGWRKGEGLGVDRKGITVPIQVQTRASGSGLGFGSTKKKREPETDQEPLAASAKPRVTNNWKQGRPKMEHQKARNIVFAELERGSPASQTILDFTKHDGGSAEESPVEYSTKYIPELIYNIGAIVNIASEDVRALPRNYRNEEQKLALVRQRIRLTSGTVEGAIQQISESDHLCHLLETCGTISAMEELQELIVAIGTRPTQNAFPIGDVLISLVAPVMKQFYSNWNLLEETSRGMAFVKTWITHFRTRSDCDIGGLIMHTWLPAVRTTVNNIWNVQESEPVVRFIHAWKPVLPSYVVDNIIHQLVAPKLEAELGRWNPRKDSAIPMHEWILPWVPYLENEIRLLLPTIRHKLASVLQGWIPPQENARAVHTVLPWKSILDKQSFNSLLTKSAVPKLTRMLQDFAIDPSSQSLDEMNAFFEWHPVLRRSTFYTILERTFFHRWLHTLYIWLRNSNDLFVVFGEVSQWYEEWKSVFPVEIRENSVISAKFRAALDMMNYAMTHGTVKGFHDDIYALASPPADLGDHSVSVEHVSSVILSFKDTVALFAEKHGIPLIPTAKQDMTSGKDIYLFGLTPIWVGDEIVFAQLERGREFIPVSLHQLLELQQNTD